MIAPTLKASYTVPELASMSGQSRWVTLHALESANVPLHRRGRTFTVYLSDLRDHHPALWESILEVLRYGAVGGSESDE